MNIAFFLLPKSEVVILEEDATIRQALEKMEYHGYSAVPVVDAEGKYLSTLTEGDILWTLKKTKGLDFANTSKVSIRDIERKREIRAVYINADMMDLIELAKSQNYVPVTDDQGTFIGIVRRGDIISYYYNQIR